MVPLNLKQTMKRYKPYHMKPGDYINALNTRCLKL